MPADDGDKEGGKEGGQEQGGAKKGGRGKAITFPELMCCMWAALGTTLGQLRSRADLHQIGQITSGNWFVGDLQICCHFTTQNSKTDIKILIFVPHISSLFSGNVLTVSP